MSNLGIATILQRRRQQRPAWCASLAIGSYIQATSLKYVAPKPLTNYEIITMLGKTQTRLMYGWIILKIMNAPRGCMQLERPEGPPPNTQGLLIIGTHAMLSKCALILLRWRRLTLALPLVCASHTLASCPESYAFCVAAAHTADCRNPKPARTLGTPASPLDNCEHTKT